MFLSYHEQLEVVRSSNNFLRPFVLPTYGMCKDVPVRSYCRLFSWPLVICTRIISKKIVITINSVQSIPARLTLVLFLKRAHVSDGQSVASGCVSSITSQVRAPSFSLLLSRTQVESWLVCACLCEQNLKY